MRTKLSPASNHSQGSHVKDRAVSLVLVLGRHLGVTLSECNFQRVLRLNPQLQQLKNNHHRPSPGEPETKKVWDSGWAGWQKLMWASLEIREIKGLCLKMFQKEYEGMNQYFCISLLRILVVFTGNVLFSSTLIFSKFSPYIRTVFLMH